MTLEIQTLAEWERAGDPDMLSVVIPAHNEEGHIRATVEALLDALQKADCSRCRPSIQPCAT